MSFNKYPYTDFHEMNDDWIISKIKNVEDAEKNTAEYKDQAIEAKNAAQGYAESASESKNAAANSAASAQASAENAAASAQSILPAATRAIEQVEILQSQVDNIIPDGTQTEGNTELIDIRTEQYGISSDSAGNAVRDQISRVRYNIEELKASYHPGFNLFDKNAIYTGYRYGNLTGSLHADDDYYCTAPIPVKDAQLMVRCNKQCNIVRFDATGSPIETSTPGNYVSPNRYATNIKSTHGNASFIAFYFENATDPDEIMITYTNETNSGDVTVDKWAEVFPGLSYQAYELIQETEDITSKDVEIESYSVKQLTKSIDSYTGSLVIDAPSKGSGTSWFTLVRTCEPLKSYVLEFLGKCNHPEYLSDGSKGAFIAIEFYDASGTIIGSYFNSYITSSDMRYHKYEYIAPIGAHSVHLRFRVRANTTCSLSNVRLTKRDTYFQRQQNGLFIEGHRGVNTVAPENTMPAFVLGKLAGFSAIITNINCTADGVLVALHDDTIDRTSNGSGDVRDFTYAELLDFDFGSWFNAAYTGTKIPTFENVVKFHTMAGMKMCVSLHHNLSESELDNMVEILKKYNQDKICTIKSFEYDDLLYLAGKLPDATFVYYYNNWTSTEVNGMLALGVDHIVMESPGTAIPSDENIAYAMSRGVIVSIFTAHTNCINDCIAKGITRFCTDACSDFVLGM